MNKNISKKKILFYLLLLCVGIYYFLFLGESGYVIERDSATFLQANDFIFRHYFIYVGFLRLCQYIFGKELQLYIVFLIQSGLAWVVSVIITEYFRKRFELRYIEAFGVFVCTLLPYGYSLPENVATHHILTEGLSFSFFHLFLLFSIIVFLEKKVFMMIPAGIMAVLLMLTRSQLFLLLVIYIILWLIIGLRILYSKIAAKYCPSYWKVIMMTSILGCIIVPFIMIAIVKSGVSAQFTAAVSGRVFCTVEEKDREYLNEEYRELYDLIYKEVDDKKQRESYFRKDLWRWEDVAYSTNENTKMLPKIISEYCDSRDCKLGNREEILNYLTSVLLEHHIMDYLKMTVVLCVESLVVSIFIQPTAIYTFCWLCAGLIYLCAILLVIYSKKINCCSESRIPLGVTGLILFGNVVITNLFFYGQQRYVVYCFGFFYISLYVVVKGIVCRKKHEYSVNKS